MSSVSSNTPTYPKHTHRRVTVIHKWETVRIYDCIEERKVHAWAMETVAAGMHGLGSGRVWDPSYPDVSHSLGQNHLHLSFTESRYQNIYMPLMLLGWAWRGGWERGDGVWYRRVVERFSSLIHFLFTCFTLALHVPLLETSCERVGVWREQGDVWGSRECFCAHTRMKKLKGCKLAAGIFILILLHQYFIATRISSKLYISACRRLDALKHNHKITPTLQSQDVYSCLRGMPFVFCFQGHLCVRTALTLRMKVTVNSYSAVKGHKGLMNKLHGNASG